MVKKSMIIVVALAICASCTVDAFRFNFHREGTSGVSKILILPSETDQTTRNAWNRAFRYPAGYVPGPRQIIYEHDLDGLLDVAPRYKKGKQMVAPGSFWPWNQKNIDVNNLDFWIFDVSDESNIHYIGTLWDVPQHGDKVAIEFSVKRDPETGLYQMSWYRD